MIDESKRVVIDVLYPVYPQYYRKRVKGQRKDGRIFGVLSIASLLVLVAAFVLVSGELLLTGFFSSAFFGALYLSALDWKQTLCWVLMDEAGIRVVDEKGDVLRGTEYCYVRHVEERTLSLTVERSKTSHRYSPILTGPEVRLIMVYFDGAYCFEDLKLADPRLFESIEKPFYWCEEVLTHHSCIAFEYDQSAWELLQTYVCL